MIVQMTIEFDEKSYPPPTFRIGRRETQSMTHWWSYPISLDEARELRDLLTEAIERGTR